MLRIKCEDINKSMKNLLTLLFLLIVGSVAADYFIFHPGVAINKTTLNQLRASELNKLNAFRLKHRVKKLTRNTTLQTAAQNYANQLCSTLTFAHSTEAIDG